MCGATSQQKQLEAEQADFYKQLISMTQQEYSGFTNIINSLTASVTPILQKGINQEGFDQGEKANLDTMATEGVAANFQHAKEAMSESEAARGGGNTFLPSGEVQEEQANLDIAAADQQSKEQQQILEADYATGRQNYLWAEGALSGVAQLENPEAMASVANQGGNAAATTANEIAQANDAWMAPVFGAIGGIAGAAIGKIPTGGAAGGGAV